MTVDEWVSLVKGVGPDAFKAIALAFLRERYGRSVQYADGTGDGGVDAWVLLSVEPRVRVAAQFHAGQSNWKTKLSEDLDAMVAFRKSLAATDPSVGDFRRLLFVCTQTPTAVSVENVVRDVFIEHGISIEVLDARSIVSVALEHRGELWRLLAQQLPGYNAASTPLVDPRDEARLAFAFFDTAPDLYRRAVAKSALATVLHRQSTPCPRDLLLEETASLLGFAAPTSLVRHALRDLTSERLVEEEGDSIRATHELVDSTRATLALAAHERGRLREACITAIEPLVAPRKHNRAELAARAVDAVIADLGVLVRSPIAAAVAAAVDPAPPSRMRAERDSTARWRAAAERVAAVLDIDDGGIASLQTMVSRIAEDPFAKRLAAAELFATLVEHDAQEFERALSAPSQRVLLDTSIGLPVLCARYARPIASWITSSAANALYESLRARSAHIAMPSVYVEEIASHLLNARRYADAIEEEVELSRSKNYFVAHYCSLQEQSNSARTRGDFMQFLRDFGGNAIEGVGSWDERRSRVEREVYALLARYAIDVEVMDGGSVDIALPNEPRRDRVVLEHDRVVVSALVNESRASSRWLVCSADSWLRGVLNDRGVLALDCVGLVDLLELVRPNPTRSVSMLSPIELASSLREQAREMASQVWDAIIRIQDGKYVLAGGRREVGL
jgi:hypothetical protein